MTRFGWILTILLGLLGIGIGAWQFLVAPKTYSVAVGPAASEDSRVLTAFAQALAREDAPLRLKIVHTDGYAANAAAMAARKVDLAVVRSDIDAPSNGSTIAILRRDFAIIVAPANSGIERIGDLFGKRIGINRNQPANEKLARAVLQHYGIGDDMAILVPVAPGSGHLAFNERQIDALLAVAPLEARGLSDAISAAAAAGGGNTVFLPIRDAAALAQRFPNLEAGEILRGAFGGAPPRPSETVPTIAVSRRLFAANDLSDNIVADITRLLYQLRAAIERDAPVARNIEAPESERGLAMPTHPGAIAYLEGEQQTFLERYSDYLYISAMLLSLVGSLGVAFWSRAAQSRRRAALEGLGRLLELLAQARIESDGVQLDAIEREADEILADTLSEMGDANLDESGLAAYRMAFDQVGRAVGERRRTLALQRMARPA